MDEDETVPIIIGRPFLATAHTVIDVHVGKLRLRVGNEVVTFSLGKSVKAACSRGDYLYHANHTAYLVQEKWVDTPIHEGKWTDEEDENYEFSIQDYLYEFLLCCCYERLSTSSAGLVMSGLDDVNPVIRLQIKHGISRGTRRGLIICIGTVAGVDINTLTMKQYLALSRENQAPGVVKPEIRGIVNFEIKSQFMQELREDTFSGNKNEDDHDHVDRVLNNVTAKRWVDRLTPGAVNTWDLLKKAFIQRYCPPSKTVKRLEDIHNLKQESDDSLYQAWERYNDLLYKCPTHDINSHQKVNIFYKGLSTMNRQLLDSHGPIPGMTPTQALTSTQTMADHSQKCHDETSSKNISSNSNTDGLTAIVSKLDNLGRNMKKLKENVHAIQVGC
ncbi:hypothetical protein Tco_1085967, partial [Tanacetum coccineum]